MKCSDIPDRTILEFLLDRPGWIMWWPNENRPGMGDAFPLGTPPKLMRAKMRKLILRGLVSGCDCGCRGDFEITREGRVWLAKNFGVYS